jgi:lactoylglutathione lyase
MISNNTNAQVKTNPTLNHVAVYVYDLQKSAEFYKNIIGLESIPEPFHDGRHEWFRIGAHSQMHLIKGAKSISEHDKDSHLCFSVGSMEEFIANLNKNKISYENWPGESNKITTRPDGVKQIYFKDPDGYWIEINDDKF